jgi:uncharacterized protein
LAFVTNSWRDEMAAFLSAEWRQLLMLNFVASPRILEPLLPRGTELDSWQGHHYLSLVGLMFLETRVLGIALPWYRQFQQVNLRFYVRRCVPGEWRRGVVFIKEIVPRRILALAARSLFHEPYEACPMMHRLDSGLCPPSPAGGIMYGWRLNGRWNRLSGVLSPPWQALEAGSEAQFLVERYWGYTARRSGVTSEIQITHAPWRVCTVSLPRLACDVSEVYGPSFVEPLAGPPASAFVADGAPVAVHRPTLLGAG